MNGQWIVTLAHNDNAYGQSAPSGGNELAAL